LLLVDLNASIMNKVSFYNSYERSQHSHRKLGSQESHLSTIQTEARAGHQRDPDL